MSRARVHEVSTPISLFPFIGILLCTTGALLVVLVAVSRSARDSAEQLVHSKNAAARADVDTETQKKLADVRQYMGALATIRGNAERKLRDENARLSHVEDHIRRLQEKMRSLQIAAEELETLEQEHYDDREQAERETARLNVLIEDSRKTIDSLQEAADTAPSSYALVPYEGPNGTFRRPIYIECVKDGLILQPEGVRILASDLRRPIGAGNPLAAALRAGRDHYVQLYPKEGKRRDTEPYPLLVVRPDGLHMFDRARQAIEAGDFDLGFELVEADWELKYPQPDPQLASVEQLAVEQARARQEVLAAAAPRAYRRGPFSLSDRYGADDDGEMYGGDLGRGDGSGYGGEYGGGGSSSGIRGGGGGGSGDSFAGGGGSMGGGPDNSGTSGGGGPGGSVNVGGESAGVSGSAGGVGFGSGPQDGAPTSAYTGGSEGGSASGAGGAAGNASSFASGGGGMPAVATTDPNAPPDANGGPQNVSVMMGSQPPNGEPRSPYDAGAPGNDNRTLPPQQRGKDWALRQKGPRAVPIRRTIRVVVHQDQLAIHTDGAVKSQRPSSEKIVPFHGDTVQSVDEFVNQIHEQIDGWGIAGNGLYWRPVIILTVAPDGGARASDLARLLKNSGLELRTEETARNPSEGGPYETR